MEFLNIVGARPNFMKIAPFQRELDRRGHQYTLVHTGQHFDQSMSGSFFNQLNISPPDYNLEISSMNHTQMTAKIMKKLGPIVEDVNPEWMVVVGDVNSTLAGGLVASKKNPKLAHIEAGIRSGNWNMPEEINRVIVDRISDLLFCFDENSVQKLEDEGIPSGKIHLTGDIMSDSLLYTRNQSAISTEFDPPDEPYALLTLHRPSNVDSEENLEKAFDILEKVDDRIQIIFSCHPRTMDRLEKYHLIDQWENQFTFYPPLDYPTFVKFMENATVVLTDSGSIQQETTVLKIPCLTLREETEREITIDQGTNELVAWNEEKILSSINQIKQDNWKSGSKIPKWDGKTASRIVKIFENFVDT